MGRMRSANKRRKKRRPETDDQRQSREVNNFPFLVNEETVQHVRRSKVMFVMRGLPGSGKSTIVRRLQTKYKTSTVAVCSADDYFLDCASGVYTFCAENIKDAHAACQEKATAACETNCGIVVIDNTNVRCFEARFYLKLAARCDYTVVVVTPRTAWRFDPAVLAAKNSHGVSMAVLERRAREYQTLLPLYWAWFINETDSKHLLGLGEKYVRLAVEKLKKFRKFLAKERGTGDLTFPALYGRSDASTPHSLHCTAFYCGNRPRHEAESYAGRSAVQRSDGRASNLTVIGLVITPNTVGARVALDRRQMELWNNDDDDLADSLAALTLSTSATGLLEKVAERPRFQPTAGSGSRAHVTLGWSGESRAVQTGYDLLDAIQREHHSPSGSAAYTGVDGAALRYYGDGCCVVYLDHPVTVKALFSGKY